MSAARTPPGRRTLVEATSQRNAARQASRIVLGIVSLVTLIPAVLVVIDSSDGVVFAALGAGIIATLYTVLTLHLVNRDLYPAWLSALNGVIYATLISCLLLLFIQEAGGRTLAYVPILFMLYILLIGASSLREEERLPLISGLTSAVELVAITAYARHIAADDTPARAEALLREFDWARTVARLLLLAAAAVLAKELARRGRMLREQTVKDELTGLLNRASFDEILDREYEKAGREPLPIAIGMLDLDHFKRLNDTRGHAVGDAVLRGVGRALRESFDEHEIVGRYGGEEFVVALPGAMETEAQARLEKVRRAIEKLDVRDPRSGDSLHVSVSAGVAVWPHDGPDLGGVFRAADERLYVAKEMGRNRVVSSQPPR